MQSTNESLKDRVVHLHKAKRELDVQLQNAIKDCKGLKKNNSDLAAELQDSKLVIKAANDSYDRKVKYRKRKIAELDSVIEEQRKD